MSAINLLVKLRLSGEELEIEVDDNDTAGKLAEGLRKELSLPDRDGKGAVTYKLVQLRTGTLLNPALTLQAAGVQNQDQLSFWGEPTAAGAALNHQRRLLNEYEKVMRRFGKHPRIKIATQGNPPEIYVVTYNLKAPVGRGAAGQLQFAHRHVLTISIPQGYPREAQPGVSIQPATYHPNVHATGKVCIGSGYYMTETIADVIAKVGNYLVYNEVGLASPYRGDIRDWIISEQRAGRVIGPFEKVGFDEVI